LAFDLELLVRRMSETPRELRVIPVSLPQLAQTVLIMSIGTALESVKAAGTPTGVYQNSQTNYTGLAAAPGGSFSNNVSGGILFTNNVCQLETRVSHQREDASVFIYTPDHLTFSNNHCWLDSTRLSAWTDALLLAGSLQVMSNRFQESPTSVLVSGLTVGAVNITSQNISTYCLLALGTMLLNNNNLAPVQGNQSEVCAELNKAMQAGQ
jgi:hypothetical protein